MVNALALLDLVITGLTLKENMEAGYLEALEVVKVATKEGRDVSAEELAQLDIAIEREYNKWKSNYKAPE